MVIESTYFGPLNCEIKSQIYHFHLLTLIICKPFCHSFVHRSPGYKWESSVTDMTMHHLRAVFNKTSKFGPNKLVALMFHPRSPSPVSYFNSDTIDMDCRYQLTRLIELYHASAVSWRWFECWGFKINRVKSMINSELFQNLYEIINAQQSTFVCMTN